MTRASSIRNRSYLRPGLLALIVGGLLASAGLASAEGPEDEARIKYRQSLMAAVGANMGSISGILKNGLVMPGHVASHARQLSESSKLISAAFKQNIATGATDAKAEIWSDWAKFEEAIVEFGKASRTLESAAADGDPGAIGAAVKGLGKSCGGCHKPFRKPKEESFRNK